MAIHLTLENGKINEKRLVKNFIQSFFLAALGNGLSLSGCKIITANKDDPTRHNYYINNA